MTRLLLLEDEPRVASFVKRGLEAEGYAVIHVSTGRQAVERAFGAAFDLIVLDVVTPDLNGMEVCERLRAGGLETPILMLTARDGVADVVDGLRRGADDYLTKPFAFEELLARLHALVRRGGAPMRRTADIVEVGDLRIDRRAHEAWLADVELGLTTREFATLALLAANAGGVLSRERILSAWGVDEDPFTNVVDVYVARLRRKLRGSRVSIETVRGAGYRLIAGKGTSPGRDA